MKITLYLCGKTIKPFLIEGLRMYSERISHFIVFELITMPDVRKRGKMSEMEFKKKEGEVILKRLKRDDILILLDEHGTIYNSMEFSSYLEKQLLLGQKQLNFLIGGPFGFSQDLYNRSNGRISLSRMTFSHQLIRLIFLEQLYRAFTIMKGLPYHNS